MKTSGPSAPAPGYRQAAVFRWLAGNREFRRSYAFARQCQAEDLAFEILKIAADSNRNYVRKTRVDGNVTWVFDKENIARQRLRISTPKGDFGVDGAGKYGNQ